MPDAAPPAWLVAATEELAHLGFVLRDGERPGTTPGPRLLVAFRRAPTLEHFDPEEVAYWVFREGRGVAATFGRPTPVPLDQPFSWGRIRVSDRIPVDNRFLAFGGTMHAAAAPGEPATVIVAFASPAPIVRWSGHSQGIDPLTAELGAFFGRIKVPIDYQPGAESRIGEVGSLGLYAAFLEDVRRRHAAARRRAGLDPAFVASVRHEHDRLSRDAPAAMATGVALRDWLELA